MTLMRFDPFREFDRIMEQTFSAAGRTPRSMPMTALRRGDTFLVELDLPGVDNDDIELTVERNVITVRARRSPAREDDDEVIVDERPYGEYSRQLFLGDNLDPGGLSADLRDGVLRLTVPVSEASKPRRIQLGSSTEQSQKEQSQKEQSQKAQSQKAQSQKAQSPAEASSSTG